VLDGGEALDAVGVAEGLTSGGAVNIAWNVEVYLSNVRNELVREQISRVVVFK
jgi:hypothetical protein